MKAHKWNFKNHKYEETEMKTVEIPAPKVILKGDWGGLVYAISTDFVTVDEHEKAVEKEIKRIEEEYEKKNHWSVSLRFVKKELALSNELWCLSLVQFRIRDAF